MNDYRGELEALLEAAQARIAELEAELRLWRNGAKSLAAERPAEKHASHS